MPCYHEWLYMQSGSKMCRRCGRYESEAGSWTVMSSNSITYDQWRNNLYQPMDYKIEKVQWPKEWKKDKKTLGELERELESLDLVDLVKATKKKPEKEPEVQPLGQKRRFRPL